MKLAKIVWRVSVGNPLYKLVQIGKAYLDWYRYGHVCVHALENTLTGTYTSCTIRKDTGYEVTIRWVDEYNLPVDLFATSNADVVFDTYWNIICPMVTSTDIRVQYFYTTQHGTKTVCYITETGAYYVTTEGNELVHLYRL